MLGRSRSVFVELCHLGVQVGDPLLGFDRRRPPGQTFRATSDQPVTKNQRRPHIILVIGRDATSRSGS